MIESVIKRTIPTAIAISLGLLVLLGALLPISPLIEVRLILVRWAAIIGTFAFILAFLHLIRVHLIRLGRRARGWISSFLIVLSALGSFAVVMWQGPAGELSQSLINALLIPGESALLALTAVTLTLAGMRVLRNQPLGYGILFMVVTALMLLGSLPIRGAEILGDVAAWFRRVPALAGLRGLWLGVALGTTLSGLRVILGVTRPHSDD